MSESKRLIPPPPVVRDRLARNIRERRLLRALLRLSLRAAEERRSHSAPTPRQAADGPGVDR
jgi:hypothetical protein